MVLTTVGEGLCGETLSPYGAVFVGEGKSLACLFGGA